MSQKIRIKLKSYDFNTYKTDKSKMARIELFRALINLFILFVEKNLNFKKNEIKK